jgi:hypothetical protein
MSKGIMTASVSQYSKKQVYYHNKQEKMARVKFNIAYQPHVRIAKKTSIGRRPKLSSMNKSKKLHKGKSKNRGQGK